MLEQVPANSYKSVTLSVPSISGYSLIGGVIEYTGSSLAIVSVAKKSATSVSVSGYSQSGVSASGFVVYPLYKKNSVT